MRTANSLIWLCRCAYRIIGNMILKRISCSKATILPKCKIHCTCFPPEILLTDAVHVHLSHLNEFLSSDFHGDRGLIFSFASCQFFYYIILRFRNFDTLLYSRLVGIAMETNCAPLVADLFLFCYERDFMTSLSDVKQAEIIEAFKSTSRYLDDLLNIDNPYFEGMVNRIYPPELQLNKANTSDTEAPFLDLHLSISNGFVSSKINDKRDDFDFDIVNFPFLDGDVPRSTSYGVYISQLIRFARVSSHVVDFNARNKSLTAKLLQQGYRYHKLRKTFSKFYRRHYELVSKFSVGLKTLLHQGLSEPEIYGDLVYKFKKIVGRADFSDQFRKIIVRYKRIGYNINIMRQSACLVFNPITVNNFYPPLIARGWVGRQTQ